MTIPALILCCVMSAEDVTYYKDVQPILRKHCTICHNDGAIDELDTSGGVSLGNPDAILKNPDHAMVKLSKPDQSPLYTRLLHSDPHKRMPKDDAPLSKAKIDVIRRWIETGAKLGKPVARSRTRKRSKPLSFTNLTFETQVQPDPKAFPDVNRGKLSLVAQMAPLAPVSAIAFSKDGKWLACGSYRRVVVWDLTKGTAAAVLSDPMGMVHALDFTPDSKTLWLGGGDPAIQGEIKAYRAGDWKSTFTFDDTSDVVYSLAVSPDGKRLATVGYDKFLRIFSLPDNKLRHSVKAHSDFALTVSFSKDSQFVLTGGKDAALKRWNSGTGKLEQAYSGHNDSIYAALFSPDSKQIFSSGAEPQFRKFDTQKGSRPQRQGAHSGIVYQMAWDAKWSRMISAGTDRNVRTWRTDAGSEKTLRGATDVVYCAALGPNGKLAAAGCWDGYVRVWNVDSSQMIASLFSAERPDGKPADWIAVIETGFYSASPSFTDRARWVMSGKTLPFDRVAAALQKPEELVKALKGAKPGPVKFDLPEPEPKSPPEK